MSNEGLLFIPDISGYTRFINETEIEHSRFIIQELLEILLNSNTLGLSISEIEGDAILFYRFGQAPAIEEIYQQVETMFRNYLQSLLPIPVTHDAKAYAKNLKRMVAMVSNTDLIIPGHDPLVFTKFPSVAPDVVKIK